MTTRPRTTLPRIEWPTVLLTGGIYAGWIGLTLFWNQLSPWLIIPLGGWLGAWHMSLQHEVIHGHPTRHQRVNDAIGFVPISLWLPYGRYKDTHLQHHHDEWLTDPMQDPESAYVTAAQWQRMGPVRRWLHRASTSFAGRLIVAPWRAIALFWRGEVAEIMAGNRHVWRLWLGHLAGVALVLVWLLAICHVHLPAYGLMFVWPAYGLALIRSLVEHRAAEHYQDRTAVVEHGGPLALLFLYNNLHVLHHDRPAAPWYHLPSLWRAEGHQLLLTHKGPLYRSYLHVMALYGLRPHLPDPVLAERPGA